MLVEIDYKNQYGVIVETIRGTFDTWMSVSERATKDMLKKPEYHSARFREIKPFREEDILCL